MARREAEPSSNRGEPFSSNLMVNGIDLMDGVLPRAPLLRTFHGLFGGQGSTLRLGLRTRQYRATPCQSRKIAPPKSWIAIPLILPSAVTIKLPASAVGIGFGVKRLSVPVKSGAMMPFRSVQV